MSSPDRLWPVTALFLSLKTIVIFTWNRPGISRRSGGFRKLREEMLRRGFLPSSEGSELYLCMPKNFFGIQRYSSLCEAGCVPESRHLNYQTDDNHEKEDRTPDNNRPQGSTGIISNSRRTRISALSRCFVKQDWSITAAGLSSNASSLRVVTSVVSTTLRRCNSSHG